MWCANQMADLLAKEAAESVRYLPDTRAWLKNRAKDLAVYVGKLTFEANAHKRDDGEVERDSESLSACGSRAKHRPKAASTKPLCTEATPASVSCVSAPALQQSGECNWSSGPRVRACSVPSAVAATCAKQRVAQKADECKKEAFQAAWCDSCKQRLKPRGPLGKSGGEILEAIRARLVAKRSTSCPSVYVVFCLSVLECLSSAFSSGILAATCVVRFVM